MTLRSYIWGMRIITLFSLVALGFVVVYIDPQKSVPIGIIIFYAAVFFALTGIINLFLLFLRRKLLGNELAVMSVGLSFRQGVLLSLMTLGIMILQGYRALVWWDALLIVAGIFLIELYFLSRN